MKRIILFIIGILLITMPVATVGYVSHLEMKKYEPNVNYTIYQKSYGDPEKIQRVTFEEKIIIDGVFTSNNISFVDFNHEDGTSIKSVITTNSEVKKNDILLYVNNMPVYSPVNGIVKEINTDGQKGYIKILNVDDLLFETNIDKNQELKLNKEYKIDDNMKVKLVSISNIIKDSKRRAYFKVYGKKFSYGETAQFTINTGIVHKDVLAVKKDAVYQKEKNGRYYIRQVTSTGKVIDEVPVKVGAVSENIITITGIDEGSFCDSEYGKLMNASLSNEQNQLEDNVPDEKDSTESSKNSSWESEQGE